MSLPEALGIALTLSVLTIPMIILGVLYYMRKRLEHKQIMAAIEKGTPLSEIRPPKVKPVGPVWIRYISFGIAAIISSLGFFVSHREWTLLAFIFCGVGVGRIVRGILHHKYATVNSNGSRKSVVPNAGQV
jgi:hypothetical protein